MSLLPRLCVVPFLGLTVIHHRGALGAVWSMWSMTDFHWKSTVHGEADSWAHDYSKEVPPYYAENNDSSTCQQGPTRRATVFREKNVRPAVSSDPPEVPPYYAQKNGCSPC